jgi:hypothetical protein
MPDKSRQRCGRCKRWLALDKFTPYRQRKSGKWCRECFNDHKAEYRRRLREGVRRQGVKRPRLSSRAASR